MAAKRKIAIVAGVGVLALLVGFVVGPRIITGILVPANHTQDIVAEANWVDQGSTVSEMANLADLIVRVRVVKSEPRVLKTTLPQYEADPTTPVGYVEVATAFTDSQAQVLEVYKGKAEDIITIMQTGALPGTVPDSIMAFSLAGDPILNVGGEHILFLVDITNDGVHSIGRKLYRTMNPFGRYELKDGRLITPADVLAEHETIPSGLPTSLDGLIDQIRLSVNS